MKLRTFVLNMWMLLMLVAGAFGTYYIITGENLLTGQTRDAKTSVLDASDIDTEALVKEKLESSPPVEKNKDLVLFEEVVNKTTDKNSVSLESKDPDSEAVIFFRFGKEAAKNYIAVFGEGLDKDSKYTAWLVSDTDSFKVGDLKNIDDTAGHKLALITEEDIQSYTLAVITKDEDSTDDYVNENAVLSADVSSLDFFTGVSDSEDSTSDSTDNTVEN